MHLGKTQVYWWSEDQEKPRFDEDGSVILLHHVLRLHSGLPAQTFCGLDAQSTAFFSGARTNARKKFNKKKLIYFTNDWFEFDLTLGGLDGSLSCIYVLFLCVNVTNNIFHWLCAFYAWLWCMFVVDQICILMHY